MIFTEKTSPTKDVLRRRRHRQRARIPSVEGTLGRRMQKAHRGEEPLAEGTSRRGRFLFQRWIRPIPS